MRTSEGKLIFGIFSLYSVPDLEEFLSVWNDLAKENHLAGFEFFALVKGRSKWANVLEDYLTVS